MPNKFSKNASRTVTTSILVCLKEIDESGQLYLIRLEDEESFFSLIWQESDPARLLTPADQPRATRDVVSRLIANDYSFESLSKTLGKPRDQHHPEWFLPCVEIDRVFDFNKFGWVAVVAANDDGRRQSPGGSFYLFDGMHKTLVLAKRLMNKKTDFQPIEALYLVPRRN